MKTSTKLIFELPFIAAIMAGAAKEVTAQELFTPKENGFYGMSNSAVSMRMNLPIMLALPPELQSQFVATGNAGTDLFKGQKKAFFTNGGSVNLAAPLGKNNNFFGTAIGFQSSFLKNADNQSNVDGAGFVAIALGHYWAKEDILAMFGGSLPIYPKDISDTTYNLSYGTLKLNAMLRISHVAVGTQFEVQTKKGQNPNFGSGLTDIDFFADIQTYKQYANLMIDYKQGTNTNSGTYEVGVGAETQERVYQKDHFFGSVYFRGIKDRDTATVKKSSTTFDRYKLIGEAGYKFNKAGLSIGANIGYNWDKSKNKGFFGGVTLKKDLWTPYTPRKMTQTH